MIDYAKIICIGGKGGDGSGSFTHIKGKRLGKADGGDGGTGGNVFLIATRDLNTLEPFRYVKEYKGRDGAHGLSRRRKGAEGEELVIKVPVGTLIRSSGNQVIGRSGNGPDNQILFDLIKENQQVLVARGGESGKGNSHLRDEYRRRPKVGERGGVGEACNLTLELKLIADVGLIGLPNSGKSTLLRALTSAKPKVADYPFTTLEPNLGVLDSSQLTVDSSQKTQGKTTVNSEPLTDNRPAKLVIADIPGLIEGASEGKGLGDLFLRHIERTNILVHMIDVSSFHLRGDVRPTAREHLGGGNKVDKDLWKVYQSVRNELRQYSKDLVKKKEIIVLNKIDLVKEQKVEETLALFKRKKKRVVAISASLSSGLDNLIGAITLSIKY